MNKRVNVWDGSGKNYLGLGTLQDYVTVYAVRYKGALVSLSDAETPPPVKDGMEVETIHNNPKILLDDGRTVYGCQVWWGPAKNEGSV
jgi:hypothetical protein